MLLIVNPTSAESPSSNAPSGGATICRSKLVAIGSMYLSGIVSIARLSGTCTKLSIETLSLEGVPVSASLLSLMMTFAVSFSTPDPYSVFSSAVEKVCSKVNEVALNSMPLHDQIGIPSCLSIRTSTVKSPGFSSTTLASVLMTAALVRVLPHPPEYERPARFPTR